MVSPVRHFVPLRPAAVLEGHLLPCNGEAMLEIACKGFSTKLRGSLPSDFQFDRRVGTTCLGVGNNEPTRCALIDGGLLKYYHRKAA